MSEESRTQRGGSLSLLLFLLLGLVKGICRTFLFKRVDRVCGQNCGQVKLYTGYPQRAVAVVLKRGFFGMNLA